MHNCLPRAFSEDLIELISMVHGQIISYERLASVFIYSLQDLRTVINGASIDHCQAVTCNRRTLYPAAYPRPGNKEVNLRAAVASEYCLKITALRFEADVI